MLRAWPAAAAAVALHLIFLAAGSLPAGSSASGPPRFSFSVRLLEAQPPAEAVPGQQTLQPEPTPAPTDRTNAAAVERPHSGALQRERQQAAARSMTTDASRPEVHGETPGAATAAIAAARPPAVAAAVAPQAAAEPALPSAPGYLAGIRLDPGPRPLEDIEPDYPDPVYLREGTVVLRLLISETGRVDNVAVVRAEPRGVFEQAALDAFGKAKFAPGMAAGTPVKSQITVEVRFVPINRGARVSGRTY
jgi:protein TonB